MGSAVDDPVYSIEPPSQSTKFEIEAPTSSEPSTYDKLTAGYNPNVEEWAQKHPVVGPIIRFLDATGGAALSTPEAIAKGIKDAVTSYATGSQIETDTGKSVSEAIKGWADPNIRRGALSVLPEALGQGAGSVAGGEIVGAGASKVKGVVAPEVSDLLKKAQTKVAQTVYDPTTGKIQTPYELAVKAALPDPYAPQATPAKTIPKGTNYGQFLLDEAKKARQAKIDAALAAKNAPEPAPSNPFAGMTSTTPAEVQTMPVRSMENTPAGSVGGLPRSQDLQGSPTPFPAKFDYKPAGDIVSGMKVRSHVPNTSSIGASFNNYETLPGVREFPMDQLDAPPEINARTKDLAAQIKNSGEINPLIVAIDKDGPYILEGGHRFDALKINGAKSFPAIVVKDLDSLEEQTPQTVKQAVTPQSQSAPNIKFVSKFEEPPAPDEPYSQDLITRNQRLVRPNEMPTEADLKRAGDYTQIPALRLRALKKFGDRLAANELTRRGIND